MQRLGQHFLVNHATLEKIAAALEPRENDTIIEIGPGHGELTSELLALSFEVLGEHARTLRIIAIEKDFRLAEELRLRFANEPRLEIITGDALKVLPEIISASKLTAKSYKLLGNIPYYITGHLLRVISELPHLPAQCVFTLQKEVAERICARPKGMNPVRGRPPASGGTATTASGRSASHGMNRLAASVQFWAEPKIIATVPREDFRPMPKVDSAIIKLDSRFHGNDKVDRESYYRAVRALFAQPRKTIGNNIAASSKWQMAKSDAIDVLKKAGINPNDRPQDLTVEQIAALSKIM